MERVHAIAIPAVTSIASTLAPESGWAYDVTGAAYDVGEYLSGVPECWLAPQMIASRPCITIAANIVSSAGIPARALEMRGAAVVALAMALQAAGYAVRVYAIQGMYVESDRDVWHRVCLTDDNGGPLDTDRLLFALAHPSASRQLGYSLGSHLAGRSYASSLGWPEGDRNALPTPKWAADVYLPPVFLDAAKWGSAEGVSAWVRETYERLSGRGTGGLGTMRQS
jgi:hypothetical protein